jgi:hypothetical protein
MPTRAVALIGFWQDAPDSFLSRIEKGFRWGEKAVVSSGRSSCTRVRNRPDPGNQVPPGALLNSKAVLGSAIYDGLPRVANYPLIHDWIGRFNVFFCEKCKEMLCNLSHAPFAKTYTSCISCENSDRFIEFSLVFCFRNRIRAAKRAP